jgi:hypothetical protein
MDDDYHRLDLLWRTEHELVVVHDYQFDVGCGYFTDGDTLSIMRHGHNDE